MLRGKRGGFFRSLARELERTCVIARLLLQQESERERGTKEFFVKACNGGVE